MCVLAVIPWWSPESGPNESLGMQSRSSDRKAHECMMINTTDVKYTSCLKVDYRTMLVNPPNNRYLSISIDFAQLAITM